MILKIGTNDGWILYDNIGRIRWGHSQGEQFIRNADGVIQCRKPETDGEYADVAWDASYLSPHEGDRKGISWATFRHDGIEKCVVFDGCGYLLNDAGKTIEAIT